MTPPSSTFADLRRTAASRSFRTAVDWLVAVFLLLWGVLFGAVGYALSATADRERIADAVADGSLTSDALSDAQLIDVTFALQESGGVALVVTGVLLALAGVVFLVVRSRSRRGASEGPDTVTNAIVGAVVAAVTSFVPFSPVLGGAVAAYLQDGDGGEGTTVGGLSGLVGAAPVVVIAVVLVVVFAVAAVQVELGGAVAVVVAAVALVVVAFSVLYATVLGALGGYLGVELAERHDRRGERETTPAE